MSEEEIMQKLRLLGFTTYEAKIYLALLKYGSLTSTEIIKVTGVPQAKFYDSIERLISKGLVKYARSRPMKYSVVDPVHALRLLIQREADNKFRIVEDILGSIPRTPLKEENEHQVWIVNSPSGISAVIEDLIRNTSDELLIASYSNIIRDFVGKIKREISTCLVIYDKYEDIIEDLVFFDEVWFKPTFGPSLIISDLRRGILIPYKRGEASVAYIFDDPEILAPIISYYFYLRETANRLIYRLGDSIKKRTFRSLLRAIDMINAMKEKNLNIEIEIEGAWVSSKKQDVVRGRPIDIFRDKLREVLTLILEREDKTRISVGGLRAIYEDFEAHRITVYAI